MKNIEKIGHVTLNYSLYSGQDLYSDGRVEDELLEIVKNYDEDQFDQIIAEKNDWAILYHLSPVRQNIINWFPFKKEDKVLEIGSGCGAITGAIARRAGSVDCVELSRRRSLINANRNKNCEGITINVGNFEEIEKHLDKDYDIITLIGVWEYSAMYLSTNDPFRDFLELLKKHLKPEGKIIIAIENKFGLKYWAGCREDHTGKFFEGLEGYTSTNGAVTFGINELEQLFEEMGYYSMFYYTYPDYKLPLRIYSDEHLPEKGELNNNLMNLDTSRWQLFDEDKVFDSIITEDMFPFFSNSFLIILSREDMNADGDITYSDLCDKRVEEYFSNYTCDDGMLSSKSPIVKAKQKLDEDIFAQRAVKIYYDYGEGFSENNCELIYYNSADDISGDIIVEKEVVGLRIDPMEYTGIVTLKQLYGEAKECKNNLIYETNAAYRKNAVFAFSTSDPWFLIPKLENDIETIHYEFIIEKLSEQTINCCFESKESADSKNKLNKLKNKLFSK